MENKGRTKTTKIEVFRILFLNINYTIESICLIAVKVWKFLSAQKTIRLQKEQPKKDIIEFGNESMGCQTCKYTCCFHFNQAA